MSDPNSSLKLLADAWAQEEEFMLIIAATLWVGETPQHSYYNITFKDGDFDPLQLYFEGFNNIPLFRKQLENLRLAIFNKELEADFVEEYEYDKIGNKIIHEGMPNVFETRVSRKNLTKWALKFKIELPLFLSIRDVNLIRNTENLLDKILDADHPYYSRDLALAIEAWNHRYSERIPKEQTKSSHIPALKKWITNRYKEKFEEKISSPTRAKRIASVVDRTNKQNK